MYLLIDHTHVGANLHFLLLPILVWETLLDIGDSPDASVGPLLVHPSLY